MDIKFNMNYILQCNDPAFDPTGPNDPYPVPTPYSIPFNFYEFPYPSPPNTNRYNYIFGSRHFYYRIVIKTHNECTGTDCLTLNKWKSLNGLCKKSCFQVTFFLDIGI